MGRARLLDLRQGAVSLENKCADPGVNRYAPSGIGQLLGNEVSELAEIGGVIHGAKEIDDPVRNPQPPILPHAVKGARGVGEHRRGDLDAGLDGLDLRMDGSHQPSDLSPAPVEEGVAEGASRKDIRGPVGDGLTGLALEAGGAAGAIAAIAVRVADVVEVDAVPVV